MPNQLSKPPDSSFDLDDQLRRLHGHMRRKRRMQTGSNLVDYDRLLGLVRKFRKDYANRPLPEEAQQILAAIIAIFGNDDLR